MTATHRNEAFLAIAITTVLAIVWRLAGLTYLVYATMLLAQNAAFTLVSRARNSRSYGFHALASVPSNGIYFLNFIVGVSLIGRETFAHGLTGHAWGLIGFYTLFTVVGSVGMHHISLTYLEKGKRALR